ncbi:protein CURVATURE THYLAKOID 1B, chloroplastic-like [Aristolochia californica]|uniref:protein CURVATURE THYLAKOID 1B, chloroplastic-like n=1 Tax=Aristolochia californica TaxID=171875 RepID=UPI0035E28724
MASTSTAVPLSSSSTFIDGKTPRQQPASPHCITLPTLSPPPFAPPQSRSQGWKPTVYCRRIARNMMTLATGDVPAVSTAEAPVVTTADAPEASTDVTTVDAPEASTELPEIVKTVQQAWDKVEDKYAVTALGVAAAVALWGSAGLISAIDKLPLVPGVLELVGIGYTGWFAYRNLVFKPDREALIKKIKDKYNDIIETS